MIITYDPKTRPEVYLLNATRSMVTNIIASRDHLPTEYLEGAIAEYVKSMARSREIFIPLIEKSLIDVRESLAACQAEYPDPLSWVLDRIATHKMIILANKHFARMISQ